jgi:DNA-binding NarL/FixJ family response regulator
MTEPATVQSTPLRVLVVDQDDRIRESLAGLLCIGGRCVVVGSAGGPDDAIAAAAAMQPDVVLLDPRLPAMGEGRAIITSIREAVPKVRVIVLTQTTAAAGDPPFEGADAYIKKTFRPQELIDAVVAAARLSVA